jgi:hypothetical protein
VIKQQHNKLKQVAKLSWSENGAGWAVAGTAVAANTIGTGVGGV